MLYAVLEGEVISQFYQRNQDGIPGTWVKRIRESMARLTPRFSANRTVREYVEKYYVNAAETFRARSEDKGSMGEQIVNWQQNIRQKWNHLRFGEGKIETIDRRYIFELHVYLDGFDPESVSIELYADETEDRNAFRLKMMRGRKLIGTENGYVYTAEVEAERPASDYTARIIPSYPGVSVPLEAPQILWQK